MFLEPSEYFYQIGHIPMCVFSWIESHSVTVGIISVLITGSLWYLKYIRQKRAEAFFGFYTRLLLHTKNLHKWLDENNMLEVNSSEIGNIYAMIYTQVTRDTICPGFHNINDDEEQFAVLRNLAKRLENTLLDTECNVYPKNSDKKSWYDSQQTLLEFCYFVLEDGRRKIMQDATKDCENESSESYIEGSIDPDKFVHVVKCKRLLAAMEKIQNDIEGAEY